MTATQPGTEQQVKERIEQAITDCHACQRICQETLAHCLQMGGGRAAYPHMCLLLDCAEIAGTTANFILRSSDFYPALFAFDPQSDKTQQLYASDEIPAAARRA